MMAALIKFSPQETERLFRLLEVIIVRFQLIGAGRTGRLESACARLARSIFKGDVTTASSAFKELKEVYPSDSEFQQAFTSKREASNQKALYLLRALESEERRLKKGVMAKENEPGTLTVEHILPRKAGDEWSAVTKKDPTIVEECALRLGNMCLLTKVNRELGRKPFSDKKPVYAKSDIILTSMLAQNSDWARPNIEQRQAHMAKIAVSVWRFQ